MESIVYLPLLVGPRIIGCLSVQSPKQHAYNADQLEFLHVLASYAAIALSNSRAHAELAQSHAHLATTHSELSAAHGELAATHQHLQETQQQLLLQEKMAGLGTLTAGVAHEINNPTNFAHVAAQILQMDIAEFEQFVATLVEDEDESGQEVLQAFRLRFARLEEHVGTVLHGTGRIKDIVKDLRTFSRLDESERKTVSISECLACTVSLVRTTWMEKVEFITEYGAEPELECWPALLNQVFMNLLVNGCQAIDEKYQHQEHPHPSLHQPRGKLWLRLRISQTWDAVEIDFEDNGIGIDPAIHARIMEPFFTTKEVGSGSGLGLSTAFGIVKKHGGTLEFTSVPGAGSCFTVRLPLPGSKP
jgi:signal transduction histidine kinase